MRFEILASFFNNLMDLGELLKRHQERPIHADTHIETASVVVMPMPFGVFFPEFIFGT
jgi:hypothetical protein